MSRISFALFATLALLVFGGSDGALSAPAGVATVPGYTIVDLGSLGSEDSYAFAINDRDQVVGTTDVDRVGHFHAFLWEAGTGMRDLGTLPGGSYSEAHGINNRGQVVGDSWGGGPMRALVWEAGTGLRELPVPALPASVDTSSLAYGINDQGQIVGLGTVASGENHAFLWEAGTGMRDLGKLPGSDLSGATAINNRGQIVGTSSSHTSVPNWERAFIWSESTGLRDLGTLPGGDNSTATGINDRGQIVGTRAITQGTAVLWQDGRILDLGGLGGPTQATGVNNLGHIVGISIAELGGSHAVLWQPVAGMPPTTTPSLAPPPNAAGWERSNVTVTLAATAASGGLPVQSITYTASGAQTIASTTVQGSTATVTISAEGTTTLSYFATDQAGNKEQAKTLVVKIDKTPPMVTCQASPSTLWPPKGKLVPVQVGVSVTDPNGSGRNGYTLKSITSNEGNIATEQQGFTIGTASTGGKLLADRDGKGTGRIYTLTYQGSDVAGNTATCAVKVTVPHDQGH